ncbi:fructosamine kinase family protein [Agrococcus terreus]|uniref:Fructosamine kinase n=1 Tax=Agrococcus terreus TaxID=574649 RepID=A0ABQ2KKT0_9MICO|nr:fructosamine kinase family protein [Agrococcus terreus]GGN85302.1 fructosamine kinase [Agrococcus terreus]
MSDAEVVKRAHAGAPHALAMEAAGLAWLAEAEVAGGTRIARARLDDGGRTLRVARVDEEPATPARAAALGRSLALLHASGAPHHACPPPGAAPPFEVGSSRTPLAVSPVGSAASSWSGWGEAWAATAVRPILVRCVDAGAFDAADARVLDRAVDRMAAGELDAPQPALVDGVARLHGDLWAGNVLWSDVDTGAVLIDPHAQGGHAETDLAMLALFGLPRLAEVLAAYDEASPLAHGWRERIPMQQLQPLLVHTMLFGGGYAAQALAVARSLA